MNWLIEVELRCLKSSIQTFTIFNLNQWLKLNTYVFKFLKIPSNTFHLSDRRRNANKPINLALGNFPISKSQNFRDFLKPDDFLNSNDFFGLENFRDLRQSLKFFESKKLSRVPNKISRLKIVTKKFPRPHPPPLPYTTCSCWNNAWMGICGLFQRMIKVLKKGSIFNR